MSLLGDDPLTEPLAALGEQPASRRRVWMLMALLPLLLSAAPVAPLVLAAAVGRALPGILLLVLGAHLALALFLAIFRPSLLRGIPRDISFVVRLVGATRQLEGRLKRTRGRFTAADYWAETVAKYGSREALVFSGRSYTFAEIDAETDRVARWAQEQGVAAGDTVALMCANRPEHLFCWLGLAKLGATTTLVNGALRGSSLQHALSQCSTKLVLFDGDSVEALEPLAGAGPWRFVCIDADKAPDFADAMLLPAEAPPVPASARSACLSTDTLLHIFTSGTTGLPKAAKLNHVRFFSAIVITYMFGFRETDRFYCCLPMCHTAAIGGVSLCWWLGMPLILAPKFSASHFWRDCVENRATIVQYVGELGRYLLHAQPSPDDRAHGVRIAFGNGMRPEVWPRFQERFGVPVVAEVYASTEGNANLANTVNKEGAVGFISPLLARMYPVRLVRLDASGDVLRGADGRCVLCKPGEPGELLGLVNQREASRNFAGYTDMDATRRKLVRGVLRERDCWFRTGDLMRMDEEGFVYFVDRMGDTFRYKGENVSTAEVSAAIGALRELRLHQCIVYGVQVPNVDGRAGMAALVPEPGAPAPSMSALFEGLDGQLPPYAHPRLVRLLPSADAVDTTITFKTRTEVLKAEGYDPSTAAPVFLRDAEARTYVPLDAELFQQLQRGERSLG